MVELEREIRWSAARFAASAAALVELDPGAAAALPPSGRERDALLYGGIAAVALALANVSQQFLGFPILTPPVVRDGEFSAAE